MYQYSLGRLGVWFFVDSRQKNFLSRRFTLITSLSVSWPFLVRVLSVLSCYPRIHSRLWDSSTGACLKTIFAEGNPSVWVTRVFADNFGGVGFLVVCFLYKTDPNARKVHLCGKKWPKCLFLTYFFLLGWPWIGEFDGFNNIYSSMCFPTQQNLVYRKLPSRPIKVNLTPNIRNVFPLILNIDGIYRSISVECKTAHTFRGHTTRN